MHRRYVAALAAGALLLAVPAAAADFTQPKRDPEYIQSARRQDKEILKTWGRHIPAGVAFNHLGSYRVMVHRDGLQRPVTLVPVARLAFTDAEALRSSARSSNLVIGALKVTFGMHVPEIMPGTLLLIYDGRSVHLRNIHGENLASFETRLVPLAEAQADPVVGSLAESAASLAHIKPDGTMQLFLQLTNPSGRLLSAGNAGFSKVALEFSIPELVQDDDSEPRVLVQPKQ